MMWSQLKKRIEGTFADVLRGRVEVFQTIYHDACDNMGEAWITIDKKKVATMSDGQWLVGYYDTEARLRKERGYVHPDEVSKTAKDEDIFSRWHFNDSLFEYLNHSIDDALASDNAIIRAFAMLDKRFGKRRLLKFDIENERSALVRTFFQFRRSAEGLATATVELSKLVG